MLQLTLEDDALRVTPLRLAETAGGSAWFKELYDLFAPVRKEAASASEEEVDAAIRDAVDASREKREASR